MKRKRVYIIGCSGVAKSIYDSMMRLGYNDKDIFFLDIDHKKEGNLFYKNKKINALNKIVFDSNYINRVIFSFYKPKDLYDRSEYIQNYLKNNNVELLTVIDPLAIVSPTAVVGEGCYVAPGVVIDSDVKILNNSVVLFNSVVSREVVINSNVFVSAHVSVKGGVAISKEVFIGAGSRICIDIPKNVFINAGSVIDGSCESNTVISSPFVRVLNLPNNKERSVKYLKVLSK